MALPIINLQFIVWLDMLLSKPVIGTDGYVCSYKTSVKSMKTTLWAKDKVAALAAAKLEFADKCEGFIIDGYDGILVKEIKRPESAMTLALKQAGLLAA